MLQLLDARIPLSSLNPELQRLTASKPRLYVMNKADLADPALTKAWQAYFRAAGAGCVAISAKQKGSAGQVRSAIEAELRELLEKRAGKGMAGARIRVMVVGIPNVGKSTFINNFAGTTRAKAADKPGVTRGKQWVTVGNYDLLDMPGVLWKNSTAWRPPRTLRSSAPSRTTFWTSKSWPWALWRRCRRSIPTDWPSATS